MRMGGTAELHDRHGRRRLKLGGGVWAKFDRRRRRVGTNVSEKTGQNPNKNCVFVQCKTGPKNKSIFCTNAGVKSDQNRLVSANLCGSVSGQQNLLKFL